jgi:glucan endo-1,3-alpha-glucosidase
MHRSPFGGGIESLEYFASLLHAAGKSYMAPMVVQYSGGFRSIPSWYWKPGQPETPTCSNSNVCVYAGGLGLEAQWKSVMQVQKPEWVMMLTWNDFAESYIVPIDDYRKYSNSTQAPLGWYKSQAGMDELNRYYIQWYKTGVEPTITSDSLFYSYRTHSSKLIAKMDNRTPPKIVGGPVGDDIYITTALTAPAQLQVVSGGVKTQYNLPAGLKQTAVPFQVGSQSFSLWRDGVKIAAIDGEPVVDSIDFYDYWPTTGYVETPQSH